MILIDRSQAWQRAEARATARGIRAQFLYESRQGGISCEFWETTSHSSPGAVHRVVLQFDQDGIHAICDCLSGQNERPCMHVAGVVEESVHRATMTDTTSVFPKSQAPWAVLIEGTRGYRSVKVELVDSAGNRGSLIHWRRHSDTLEWGFGGSGPMDLSL
jgi:hypothetical protein